MKNAEDAIRKKRDLKLGVYKFFVRNGMSVRDGGSLYVNMDW